MGSGGTVRMISLCLICIYALTSQFKECGAREQSLKA